jgi:ABC-type uncharacterized transport system involved in gliding motility auxiliary subunit
MSKFAKTSLIFAFLSFVALLVTRLVLGGWQNGMWVPLGMFFVFLFAAIYVDRRFWLEFFSMRTTKHGLNMGILILITMVILVVVNIMAVRYERKFDWTSEGLNSLSPQSLKIAKELKQDVEIVLLFRKEQDQDNIQHNAHDLSELYTNASNKIKYVAYNVLQRPDLAQKYEYTYGPYALFLVAGDAHVRIDKPTEEEVTRGLLKLGRNKKKIVYFVTGHGERPLEERKPEGLSELKADLDATYEVKTLTLYQEGKVPADAEAVALIGPRQQLLEPELKILREYARSGGRLLIAADPGEKHNVALLTKSFGVEFENNYVLDPRANVPGAGNVAALGTVFSSTNEITRSFQSGMMALFILASGLKKAPDAATSMPSLQIEDIVKTDGQVVTSSSVDQNAKLQNQGPKTIGISVSGPFEKDAKSFSGVIFGDSDFLSNTLYRNNLNRDLALNVFSSLAKDADLISIRPKTPAGTKLEMTRQKLVGLILGFLLPLPLLLLLGGGFVWWRRKTA